MTHTFRTLQYNVNKSRLKVTAPLLQDSSIDIFDIIAIQEPWRNPLNGASYNPGDSGFYLVDSREEGSRVCCYVNKRISIDSWSETFHSKDLVTITLRVACGSRVIHIHNCYNPPSQHSETEDLGTLAVLPQALSMPGEHILLGDFNLHHPLWGGPSYPHQHPLASTLLSQAREFGVSLALPPGTITRDIHSGPAV